MGNIDLCPRCGGRLTAVSERTGGFSGAKAVVGAALVGPVGVAAGAAGKRLVTLKCAACGYTIETDAATAREAEEFGEAYERFKAMHAPSVTNPPLIQNMGVSREKQKELSLFAYGCRKEEREKHGIDFEELTRKTEQLRAEKQPAIDGWKEKASALAREKQEKQSSLDKLGVFKWSEKKALRQTIETLSGQLTQVEKEAEGLEAELEREVEGIRGPMVERCRTLAMLWWEEYAPPEYQNLFHALCKVLSGDPKNCKQLVAEMRADMTGLQLKMRYESVRNPFVSFGDQGMYFGVDGDDDSISGLPIDRNTAAPRLEYWKMKRRLLKAIAQADMEEVISADMVETYLYGQTQLAGTMKSRMYSQEDMESMLRRTRKCVEAIEAAVEQRDAAAAVKAMENAFLDGAACIREVL